MLEVVDVFVLLQADNPCLSCFGFVKNHKDARCYSNNTICKAQECVADNDMFAYMLWLFFNKENSVLCSWFCILIKATIHLS